MSQPTPPGDMPLFEGLGTEWNDVVGALPEDRRAELAPRIKERMDQFEPYKQWDDLQKSGVTPEQANTALSLFSVIENNPERVYKQLGEFLGITTAQAKEVVEEVEENGSDSEIATLKQQVDTLSQIHLAKHNQEVAAKRLEEQNAALDKELKTLEKKYGEIDEDEILMRMLHKNMTAEQAYQEYTNKVSQLRTRRPAPMVMGQGGAIPHNAVDPTKLDGKGTRSLVAQMMEQANHERRQ